MCFFLTFFIPPACLLFRYFYYILLVHFFSIYPISKTDAGTILWEKEFQDKIIETIGDRSIAEQFYLGENGTLLPEALVGDIRNYIPEDELRAVFPEYDSLENLEKLKVRQLELEYNKFIKNLDSIPVEQISDVRANYLKAVGKTEDTLGFFDKRILMRSNL